MRDWSFLRRPFWLFSHLFALSVIVLFIFLGIWQWSRLGDRKAQNALVESRSEATPMVVAKALEDPPEKAEYRAVADRGRFVDGDLVRIGSQTQDGAAGDYVVGLVGLEDGTMVLVNRGFVPLAFSGDLASVPDGEIKVEGWLRLSSERQGFGGADGQQSERLPRFHVPTIEELSGTEVAPMWLQLSDSSANEDNSFPSVVPLPPLSEGSHLSYTFQWLIFALLGTGFYIALLRRTAVATAKASGQITSKPESEAAEAGG